LDTAKDARVLILEEALARLNDIIGNRKLKMRIEYSALAELLSKAGSLLYEVKYSYLPALGLAELDATEQMVQAVLQIGARYEEAISSAAFKPNTTKERLTMAEMQYCIRTAKGFQRRLKEYDDDPGHAVDILAVEVTHAKPVPDASKLTVCRCTDGERIWTIVTNIPSVNPQTRLSCAVLPPVDMMDTVSEAMFLGGEPLPDSTSLGLLNQPSEKALAQARAQVLTITKRMR
jgi:predicted RNA-binding protein with EMAP domain